MHPFFICNKEEIESKLTILCWSGKSEDGSEHYYYDIKSKEEWVLVHYESEFQGKNLRVLKRIPELSTNELIEVAPTSLDINNINGAALELYQKEESKKEEFRDKLIRRLLQIDISTITPFEKERLEIIIYESSLYDATNRRGILGKHFTEIEKDADYFKTISVEAKIILARLKK